MTFLVRLVAILAIIVLAATPTWIFFAGRYWLAPEGFWQNLVLVVLGVLFLLPFQVLTGAFGMVLVIALAVPDTRSASRRVASLRKI